ncbi:MAG: DUF2971 domain-containing protein [Oscillospiraceae bacterium]|nr:DUF2971 domain-containing protein [Oscillospiraceae bacterium]
MDVKIERQLKIFWNTLLAQGGKREDLDLERSAICGVVERPRSLFRFRPPTESTLDELENNFMYFSSADHYDDPFDTFMKTDIPELLGLVNSIKKDTTAILSIIKECFPEFNEKALKEDNLKLAPTFPSEGDIIKQRQNMQIDTYSVCFCESVRNESSWMKYSDNHKGFVLEYEFTPELVEGLWESEALHANLFPIYYSDKKFDATNYAIREILLFLTRPTPAVYNELRRFLCWENTKLSLIKNKCHKYDKEWRLIPAFRLCNRDIIRKKPLSVTIGLRTSKYTERTIVEAAKIAGISKFYKMEIDDRDRFVRKQIQ